MRAAIVVSILAGLASFSFGQVNGSTLRAKYGQPLPGQIFIVRPGVEMTVTYGPNDIVCKAEIPLCVVKTEQLDAIAEEVVPTSMRGQDRGRVVTMSGALGADSSSYDLVTITQPFVRDGSPERRGLTITFNDSSCLGVIRKP